MTRATERPDLPLRPRMSWADVPLVRVRELAPRRGGPGWLSRLALAVGLLLLAYVAAIELESTWAQRWASDRLQAARGEPAGVPDRPGRTEAIAPAPGEPVGRLLIPRLALDVVALEGVDTATLRRGAGHFPGTAMPGQGGNASFAGHRDSFFRKLRDVRTGDEVTVEAPQGEFLYTVTETRIVEPSAVEVVGSLDGSHLTLVTCYPFDWIGPAPRRFVVRAALVGEHSVGDRS